MERQRAACLQLESPINENIEATHNSYFTGLSFLLDQAGQSVLSTGSDSRNISVFIASHNSETLEHAINFLKKFEVDNMGMKIPSANVMFGQLLGMSDHLTFSLARLGLAAYKYVPIGRVQEVMPYLIRRAQENSSMLGRAGQEAKQIEMVTQSRIRSIISPSGTTY